MSAGRLCRTLQIMAFTMKKLILVIALGLTLAGGPAFAYDYRYDNRATYVSPGRSGLDWRINHLNRMLAHVRWQLSRYRGDWHLRREVDRISVQGEPGQLALSARLRHVAFAPRNRQLALRTASDRNAITCPLRRLLSLGLIANNE